MLFFYAQSPNCKSRKQKAETGKLESPAAHRQRLSVRRLQAAHQPFRILRAMKNVVNEDRLFIMVEVNRVGKATNKNAAKGIKSNRITERVRGDQCVGTFQTTQKLLTQPKLLILIPAIAISDIRHRFRKQNDSAKCSGT